MASSLRQTYDYWQDQPGNYHQRSTLTHMLTQTGMPPGHKNFLLSPNHIPRVDICTLRSNLLTIAPWTIAFCVATRSPDHLSVEIVQSRPDSPGRSCHLFSVARF